MEKNNLLRKITHGYVTQVYDPDIKGFVSQEFTVGDECEYLDADGNAVRPSAFVGTDGKEDYLDYGMIQPILHDGKPI